MSNVANAVMSQYDDNTAPKKQKVSNEDRLKKYFSTQLAKNKAIGQKIFRILPPKNGKSPFDEVYFHELKIGDDWTKIYCPKKNKNGECPLCEVEKSCMDSGTKEDKDIASQYRSRKFYIVKGVDREFEDHGPKFWRFRYNYKKQGILDKIVPIFTNKGDITNGTTGRDLILSLGKDDNGFTKVTSIMHEDAGLLHTDSALAQEWLDDPTTWEDVYAKKPIEYLELVAQGEIPYWDKESSKFISKIAFEAKINNSGSIDNIDDDGETTKTIGGGKKTTETTTPKVNAKTSKPEPTMVKEDESSDESDVEMEDLPF